MWRFTANRVRRSGVRPLLRLRTLQKTKSSSPRDHLRFRRIHQRFRRRITQPQPDYNIGGLFNRPGVYRQENRIQGLQTFDLIADDSYTRDQDRYYEVKHFPESPYFGVSNAEAFDPIAYFLARNERDIPPLVPGKRYFLHVRSIHRPDTDGVVKDVFWSFPLKNQLIVFDGGDSLYNVLRTMYKNINVFWRGGANDEPGEHYEMILLRIMSLVVAPVDSYEEFKAERHRKTPLHAMVMRGATLAYKMTNGLCDANTLRSQICVVDFIWGEICKNPGMKSYNRVHLMRDFAKIFEIRRLESLGIKDVWKKLMSDNTYLDSHTQNHSLNEQAIKDTGITLGDILDWATLRKNVNVFAYDHFDRELARLVQTDTHQLSLSFKVANGHIYPVDNAVSMMRSHGKKSAMIASELKIQVKYAPSDYTVTTTSKIDWETPFKVILVTDTEDLSELSIKVANDSKTFVTAMKYNKSKLSVFQHPINNKIVAVSPQYELRKKIADYFYDDTKHDDFNFANQSLPKLSKAIFTSKYGEFQESVYPPEYLEFMRSDHSIGPHIVNVCDPNDHVNENSRSTARIVSIDTRCSYTANFVTNTMPYCVFAGTEQSEPFDLNKHIDSDTSSLKPAMYWIKRGWSTCGWTFTKPAGFYPANLVNFLWKRGTIMLDDISRVLRPRFCLQADAFRKFAQEMYDKEKRGELPKGATKWIVNPFWGQLGKTAIEETYGAICEDYESTMSLFKHELNEMKRLPFISKMNGYYFVQSSAFTHLKAGHLPIAHQIMCASWIQMMKIYDSYAQFGTVVSYHTDAVRFLVTKHKNCDALKLAVESTKDAPLGQCLRIDKDEYVYKYKPFGQALQHYPQGLPTVYPYKLDTWVEQKHPTSAASAIPQKSMFITGGPGCGKSTNLAQTVEKLREEKIPFAVYTFQWMATEVLRTKGVIESKVLDTLLGGDSDLHNSMGASSDDTGSCRGYSQLKDLKVLIIDEVSSVPKKHWKLMYKTLTDNQVLLCYGDMDQCQPVEPNDPDKHPYVFDQVPMFMKLCGNNRLELQYIQGCARFDAQLQHLVSSFRNTGKLPTRIDSHSGLMVHITKWHSKRHRLNKECAELFLQKNPKAKVWKLPRAAFMNDPKSNGTWGEWPKTVLAEGTPLICMQNPKKESGPSTAIKNSFRFIVRAVHDDQVTLTNTLTGRDITIPTKVVLNRFEYAFAFTVHKIQGSEINENYFIHDIEYMNFHEAYVAISRGKLFSQVKYRLSNATKTYERPKFIMYPTELIQLRPAKCKYLYKVGVRAHTTLLNATHEPQKIPIYIGITHKTLEQRLAEHIREPTNAMMKEFFEKYADVVIEKISVFSSITDRQLRALEARTIMEYFNNDNYDVMNVQHVPSAPAPPKVEEKKTTVKVSEPKHVKRPTVGQENAKHRFYVREDKTIHRFGYGPGASPDKIAQAKALAEAKADEIFIARGGQTS